MEYNETNSNKLFPVFLKLEQLHVLIVGGGKIGLEKITAVLSNSPATRVVLVAPEILPAILDFQARYPNLEIRKREFFPSDLTGINLVISAVGKRDVSEQIRIQAAEHNILLNVADTPDLCDFYLGSVVKKGDLKIAISTNGRSPTMARRLKEMLNEVFPSELQDVLENLSVIRNRLKGNMDEKIKVLNEITSAMTAGTIKTKEQSIGRS
jgi:siroheme synthase-like protein